MLTLEEISRDNGVTGTRTYFCVVAHAKYRPQEEYMQHRKFPSGLRKQVSMLSCALSNVEEGSGAERRSWKDEPSKALK